MFTFVWFSKSFEESIVRVRTTHFLKRGVMNSRRSDFQSKAQSGELYNYVAVCKENIWWIKYTANTNALGAVWHQTLSKLVLGLVITENEARNQRLLPPLNLGSTTASTIL